MGKITNQMKFSNFPEYDFDTNIMWEEAKEKFIS